MMRNYWIGQTASATRTVTEQDLVSFSQLMVQVDANCENLSGGQNNPLTGHEVLTGSLVNMLLSACLPGHGSTLLSQQIEFLAPIQPGDIISARVEVTGWQPEKRLITLKTDCFNQAGRQILTGQAVLVVSG
jgi:3-hydroxybutyryl-CoA dehydratase